ncbi:ANR family transcriptional regulator [Vibrio europaeus]|nr:ANR family transcriptional regulator [Vibrio europaeus]
MLESNYYMDAATKAAQAEKDGMFSIAAQLWESAKYSAMSKDNRHWSACRNEYCQHQLASLLKEECEYDNA